MSRVTHSSAVKRLEKYERDVEASVDVSMKTMVHMGKAFAQTIAPNSSGILINAISARSYRTSPGATGKIFISTLGQQQLKANREFPSKEPNFNLVRWMHATGGIFQTRNPFGKVGKQHFKSGDPQFLITTSNYLASRVTSVFDKELTQVNIKNR